MSLEVRVDLGGGRRGVNTIKAYCMQLSKNNRVGGGVGGENIRPGGRTLSCYQSCCHPYGIP